MSMWSLIYQQSVLKRYHSDKHFSEFYLQDGGNNQLEEIWNKITSLSPYVGYIDHVSDIKVLLYNDPGPPPK